MGCEIELPPNNTEADRSRAQKSREDECYTKRNISNSVTLYERLEPATHNCRDTNAHTNTTNMTSLDTQSDVKCKQTHAFVEAVVTTITTVSSENVCNNVSAVEKLHNDGAPVLRNSNSHTDDTGAGQSNATNCDDNIMETSGGAIDKHGAGEEGQEEVAALSDEKKSGGGEGAPISEPILDVYVQKQVLDDLDQLKSRLDDCKEIPKLLYDVSLNCLKPSTIEYLSYHLDPEGDVLASDGKVKDYRGMAEWIGLENVFIKYIARSSFMLKTREVLSKWLTREEEPKANIKNLRECLMEIDRPDVLEDMSLKIAQDAVAWKKTKVEAQMTKNKPQKEEDTSWQLTRHDVVSGKKTKYTACLLCADEDNLMAQLITKLYKAAYKDALFFLPQFDLKQGKYEMDTTARVIDERCDKKVVVLLSDYFYASNICQFAVNYAATQGTGNGNLIPFHLTRNIDSVPNVLKGLAGIRWFRKGSRHHTWQNLTDSLLASKLGTEMLTDVKETIRKMVEKDKDYYLQDPPYDADVEPPGVPITVIEPEQSSSMSTSIDADFEGLKIKGEQRQKKEEKKSKLKEIKNSIKRTIFEKLKMLPKSFSPPHCKHKNSLSSSSSSPNFSTLPPSSQPEIEMKTLNSSGVRPNFSSQNKTEEKPNEFEKTDDSEMGAVGGVTNSLQNADVKRREHENSEENAKISPTNMNGSPKYRRNIDNSEIDAAKEKVVNQDGNDLNASLRSQKADKCKLMLNITKSESMVMNRRNDKTNESTDSLCSKSLISESDSDVEQSVTTQKHGRNNMVNTHCQNKETNALCDINSDIASSNEKTQNVYDDASESDKLLDNESEGKRKPDHDMKRQCADETGALLSGYSQS